MKVMGKRLLVKQTLTDEVSQGGIVIAGERQTLPYGEVMQRGSLLYEDDCTVEVGDIVLFNEIGAIPLGHLKKDHVLIEPDDILAVLEEGESV